MHYMQLRSSGQESGPARLFLASLGSTTSKMIEPRRGDRTFVSRGPPITNQRLRRPFGARKLGPGALQSLALGLTSDRCPQLVDGRQYRMAANG